MQMTQKRLKKVNIYSSASADSGYVGTKTVPSPLGFVYAEVYPSAETFTHERSGGRVNKGATLILRKEAGVRCGDLAAVFGNAPDSRIAEVRRFPEHLTVRTEML